MVCGIKNEFSLGARFYELENKELACTFETKEFHQSYPGRLHGGIAAAILDETVGRAIDTLEPGTWAVTVELNVKYKKPIPINAKLKAIGRIVVSYKDVQNLAGYTSLIYEIKEVLDDLDHGRYKRIMVKNNSLADQEAAEMNRDQREKNTLVDSSLSN